MAGVPDELMTRLHEANEHFHAARLQLDGVSALQFGQRADVANAVRAAEAELEQITKEIDAVLRVSYDDQSSAPPRDANGA